MAGEAKDSSEKVVESTLSLDDASLCEMLTLISKDQNKFQVGKKAARISGLVVAMLDADVDVTEAPMPGVAGNTLQLVVQFMNHHKGKEPQLIERPLRSKNMKDVCKDAWDATFIDSSVGADRNKLYELIFAANYMDMKSLMDLGCAKLQSLPALDNENENFVRKIFAP